MKALPFTDLWREKRHRATLLVFGSVALVLGAAGMYAASRTILAPPPPAAGAGADEHGDEHDEHGDEEEEPSTVELAKEKWSVAGLRIEEVERGSLTQDMWVTGKLTLNEDRVAHIYSLVDGRVHEVNVQFGEEVKQDQVLAVIDSKEVGAAKLDLYQNLLDAEFAKVNNQWNQKINTNTQELINALEKKAPITEIDKMFGDKEMGDYRQQLLTAYASLHKAKADYDRLKPLAADSVVAGKQWLEAKAIYESEQATFMALLEQLKFTPWQQALLSEQKMKQAEQAVAVAKSHLYILGYKESDLSGIDPDTEGEAISHYEIKAPFDGTVIDKNVVLAERVGPDTMMFQVADLSSVWVQADIYQKDLPKIQGLGDTLRFRVTSLADTTYDHIHEAKIFYQGDVLDEQTRTMRLRAVLENTDRHLKPGMFAEVQLPGDAISDVVTVPASALLEVEGQDVVFVQTGTEQFEKRSVTVGAQSDGAIQIREGLRPGDKVVVAGGFALKSELMKGSISHGH